MKLARFRGSNGKDGIGIVDDHYLRPLVLTGGHYQTLSDILETDDPGATARLLVDPATAAVPLAKTTLLAPVDRQEVWAAGVTYKRSKTARMEESVAAASAYDKVYVAARPELFFKSMPHRVVGPDRPVRIRSDSKWNVPEPELVLVLNSRMKLVGCAIGNDVSSRDIEGENPLYLPQAKVYNQSCAIGPWITLASAMPGRSSIGIRMAILRGGELVFEGSTSIGEMARSFEDLVEHLARDNTFRDGVCLLTGTGIVPDPSFTLKPGDTVDIAIDGIGTLVNSVVQG